MTLHPLLHVSFTTTIEPRADFSFSSTSLPHSGQRVSSLSRAVVDTMWYSDPASSSPNSSSDGVSASEELGLNELLHSDSEAEEIHEAELAGVDGCSRLQQKRKERPCAG